MYRITPHASPWACMRVLSNFGIFEMVKTFQYKPMGLKKFGLKFANSVKYEVLSEPFFD